MILQLRIQPLARTRKNYDSFHQKYESKALRKLIDAFYKAA